MADKKLTELTELVVPTRDDLLYIVDDPTGTPTHYKTTIHAVVSGPTLYVAASDASDEAKRGADYVCDGVNDQVEIQAAIDALPVAGGMVQLSGGTFVTSAVITMRSNLIVKGCGITTHITGTITAAATNYGIFYTTEDLSYCQLWDMRLTRATGGMGGIVSFNGQATYIYTGCGLYNIVGYSENANCLTYSCGDGMELVNCTLRGSDIANGQAVEIGYAGRPRFTGCRILGGSFDGTSYGLLFTDNGGGLFTDCVIEGRNYGIMVTASANPRFVGCEICATHGVPVTVQAASAPVFQGCFMHPKIYAAKFGWAGVGEIPAIFTGVDYRILSMHVRVDVDQPGLTLDIGSTLAGTEIATTVPLSPAGFQAVTPPWDELFTADQPIYLTPSAPPAIPSFRIFFSAMASPSNAVIYSTTTGNARVANSYLLGGGGGVYQTNVGAVFLNSVIECADPTDYAVNYAAGSVAYFRDCTIIGDERNVNSYAWKNSGTSSIASGTTSIAVAHGLAGTPTIDNIIITLAENPANTPGAIWVDTIGAVNFTVNCENDPGATNLDFGWKAEL